MTATNGQPDLPSLRRLLDETIKIQAEGCSLVKKGDTEPGLELLVQVGIRLARLRQLLEESEPR